MVGRKGKSIVLTLVLVAVLVVLAKPYLFATQSVFATTPEPYQAYQQALSNGEPIFLEFYATW